MDNEAVANKIGALVLQIWLMEEQIKVLLAKIEVLEKGEDDDEDSES